MVLGELCLRDWQFSSFGNFPKIKTNVYELQSKEKLQYFLDSLQNGGSFTKNKTNFIPYGNGRSYGDSALNDILLYCKPYDYFLDFDCEHGILHAQCGVMLSDILNFSVPRGYFLQVTPGTQFITLGGAIASNVHGKNHHYAKIIKATEKFQHDVREGGNFIESVLSFELMLPNGEIRICSRDENSDLFYATFGGMGLTGVILNAKIRLKPIQSRHIEQTTIKSKNLQESLEALEFCATSPYAVSWIDTLAKGKDLGRSVLTYGDFCTDGVLQKRDSVNFSFLSNSLFATKKQPKKTQAISIPFYFPACTLNAKSVWLFNSLYYAKAREGKSFVDFNTFFYPLDSLLHWNRIYGKNGFLQYQCIIPKEAGHKALQEILTIVTMAKQSSFLSVLKLYGAEDLSLLCFPMEGYSLALDFKITKDIWRLLDELDSIVLRYGGRLYLAKDSRMSRETFENSYKGINDFKELRKTYKCDAIIQSLQSLRLGI